MSTENTSAADGTASEPTGAAADRLAEATKLLRQHTDAGWTAIEGTVIARVATLFRPSAPVRGRHAHGDFFLASEVLVSHLRRAVDAVPQAAAQTIACTTGDRDELEAVTVELVAAYGTPLLALASRVHTATVQTLDALLGSLAPAADRVRTHVHVGDVSDDPRVVR